MRRVDPRVRFDSAYDIDSEGCWIWGKSLNKYGYGRFKVYGKMVGAHRFSYERFNGIIPDGMEVNHKCHSDVAYSCLLQPCKHRSCVNPNHLEVLLPEENSALSTHAQKYYCKYNHVLDGVYSSGSTKRYCKTCSREAKARERAK